MQDVKPSSALKLTPIPQLFHCMNKHVYLLSGKAVPFPLPSSVIFTPAWAKSCAAADGKIEEEVTESFLSFFCRLFRSSPFCLFFLVQLAPSLPASRVNTSCALALLHRIKSTHLELALLPQMSALRLKWAPLLQRGWVKRKFQRGEEREMQSLFSSISVARVWLNMCVGGWPRA